MIDRTSPEPYYLQLGHLLERQIDTGFYATGDRLPTESELCRQFEVSRSTVRETLRSMQENGRIRIVQRRGAFVCESGHPGWLLQFLEGFSENEAAHNGRRLETSVLSVESSPLPDEACRALELPEGSPGVMLERVRRLDGQLALYAMNYLRPEIAPVIGDGKRLSGSASLNRALRAAGWLESGARRSLEAVPATAKLAKHLGVKPGCPLLLVRSVAWNAQSVLFDYYTSWLRSDLVKVEIEVQVAKRPMARHS